MSIRSRILCVTILITFLQSVISAGILVACGLFEDVDRYAYDNLEFNTETCRNVIQSNMYRTSQTLAQTQENLSDFISDEKSEEEILSDISDVLVSDGMKEGISEIFFILNDENISETEYGLNQIPSVCICRENTDNPSSFRLKTGSKSIAENLGIDIADGWSENLKLNSRLPESDYYYDVINFARDNPDIPPKQLSLWSFNENSTIRYTMPVTGKNGEIYGVLGANIDAAELMEGLSAESRDYDENVSYMLAFSDDGNKFDKYICTGNTDNDLFSMVSPSIFKTDSDETSLYSISPQSSGKRIAGSVKYLSLYTEESPFSKQQWAVISASREKDILMLSANIKIMLGVSMFVSIALGVCLAFFVSGKITSPIVGIIKTIENKRDFKQHIKFDKTNIPELNVLTDAIEEAQNSAEASASRFYKIINSLDMEVGVAEHDLKSAKVSLTKRFVNIMAMDMSFEENSDNVVLSAEGFHNIMQSYDRYIESRSPLVYKIQVGGSPKWIKYTVINEDDKSMGLAQDITKSVMIRNKIEYERDYDVKTGLVNRYAYMSLLETIFRYKIENEMKISACIMIDIDNLKYLNESYGYSYGDEYIRLSANVLKGFKKFGGIVARMSGNEFSVFLSGFDSKNEIRQIISIIYQQMADSSITLPDGSKFKLRASGGIAWYPSDSIKYDELVKFADFAMCSIKETVRGTFAEFDEAMYKKDAILTTGLEEFNRIVEKRNVKYAFQTIVSAKDGSVYGYEALMRPQSETLRSPLEFLRIAKSCAKMLDVERMTWELTFESFRKQVAIGNIDENSKVFINSISNYILSEEEFKRFEKKNKNYLQNIVMEVLESDRTNMDYFDVKSEYINRWGGIIALDDFGTGYNNEYALLTINPGLVKIDRSIINGIDTDKGRQEIFKSVTAFAREGKNNTLILAEGIETYEEMKTVIELGADLLQGFYLSKPVFEPKPLNSSRVEEIKEINALIN